MTSTSDVVAQLDAVLNTVRQAGAAIDQAAASWGQAAAGYAEALNGSQNPIAAELAQFDKTSQRACAELAVLVTAIIRAIEAYRSHLVGSPSIAPREARRSAATTASIDARIAEAQRNLGRGVDRSRAHGRWLRDDGSTTVLSSGKGSEWYDVATSYAREQGWVPAGLPPNATIDIAKHIEVQFAMRMRLTGLTDEVIVIDRPVCGRGPVDMAWPLTCDKVLVNCLPVGSSMTVVDCDGVVLTYRREEK